MPVDLIQRIDLDLIYPPFLEKALTLLANCRAQGADYFVISGYRTYHEQAALYFQGRTTPGKKVTKARPGQSAHNFGMAWDLCRDANMTRAGLQPDWNLNSYHILQEQAGLLGLESGMSWKSFREGPHVQWRLPEGVTYALLDSLFKSGGLNAVWAALTSAQNKGTL